MEKEKSETTLISLILVIVFLLAGISLVSIRDNRDEIREIKKEISTIERSVAGIEKQLSSHLELFKHIEEEKSVYKSLPDAKVEK